jgi:cytochrome c-type biogenesis protein
LGGIFASLSHAIEAAPAIALCAAFAWGILSVVLTPCHLAGIPLIVAFVSGGSTNGRRAFALSTMFALGVLVTLAAIGLITAAAGRLIGDIGPYGRIVVTALLVLVGLQLLGVIPLQWGTLTRAPSGRKGLFAALALGLIFGAAVGPCTFAYMAPVLMVAFGVAATAFIYAFALLALFAVGHCAVLILAGTFSGAVQRYLNWNERTKGAIYLRRICGVLVLAGAAYTIYTAF